MVVVFAGTSEFAVPSLRALAAGPHRVAAVWTRPDRPAGRGRRMAASPVKSAALELGLALEQPAGLRGADARARLAAYRPDVVAVAAYGLLLPPDVLALPAAGCINVHASLLPRWRGAAPVQRALLAGDTETGVSIMQMDAGLDTGPVLLARSLPIAPGDNAGALTTRLARLGAQALGEALEGIERDALAPRPQDDAAATLAPRVRKEEAVIDWRQDAPRLERMVRAFDPWPVACTFAGGDRLRVLGAEALPGGRPPPDAPPPGTVLAAGADGGIEVQTGGGRLRLLRLQRPGGRAMGAREFLNGRLLAPGQRLGA